MKICRKDRQRLLNIIEKLVIRDYKGLNIRKVVHTDFYRLRSGRFRIIFHKEKQEIIIDGIKLKNKSTYKNL